MKSSIMTSLLKVFGGLKNNLKDWRVLLFSMLALFASIANYIKCLFPFALYSKLYIPTLWLLIAILIMATGTRSFYYIVLLISSIIVVTDEYGYRSLSIFILMLFVLSKNKKQLALSMSSIIVCFIISLSTMHRNLIEIANLTIQAGFAAFCYYGFIYTSSKAFGCKSKMQYTDKEYRVMYALATQDKTQKEICYELGISGADMARTLASAREKNGYTTNDMLLRQFAVELYKSNL